MSEAELRRRLDSVTAELLSTYEELEVLTTVAEIASATADVAVVGRRVLEEAAGLLNADVAFIFYCDPELRGEEPEPAGIGPQERDRIAESLGPWLQDEPRPILKAPFHEGASIPRAPDALLAVPLRSEGLVLGALCLGRRGPDSSFTAGDLKVLSVLGSSAASVLLQRKNLDLVRLSRGLEERNQVLKGILAISREIAASLDLRRLLHAMVNLPTKALGFDRCSVVLGDTSRVRLRAVTGSTQIDRADSELRALESLLGWVAEHGQPVIVQRTEEGDGKPRTDPPESADRAAASMELAGSRSLVALPLVDDQGFLGVLCFESGEEGFIDEIRMEGANILALQATVALRNAQLYGEVPLIGLLAPLRSGISRLKSMPRRRLAGWGAAVLATLAILIIGRWEMRVPGRATVLPERIVQISSRVRGVVREVGPYREGDVVSRGAVLAELDVPDLDLRLDEAASLEEAARRRMVRLEAEGRAADLRLAKVEVDRWKSQREHLQSQVETARLRAPIGGVVLTPRLDERAGDLLEVGEVFCKIADLESLRVEIAVREKDADVLTAGPAEEGGRFEAVIKFESFPELDYRARIDRVRESVELIGHTRWLVAEGVVLTEGMPPGRLRPGMTGNARIEAGTRPLISLILRRPYRFVRSLIWL